MAGLAIGLALVVIHSAGINDTDVSVNPARSVGPALFVGGTGIAQFWLFIVALIVGAVAAGLFFKAGRLDVAAFLFPVLLFNALNCLAQFLVFEFALRQRLRVRLFLSRQFCPSCQTIRINFTGFDSGKNCAARFYLMAAIRKLTF